jgi:hypothetical protein
MNHVEATLENNYGVTLLEMGYLLKTSGIFKSASKYLTLPPDNHPARNTCAHQKSHPVPFTGYEYRYEWAACSRSAIQDDEVKKQVPKTLTKLPYLFSALPLLRSIFAALPVL